VETHTKVHRVAVTIDRGIRIKCQAYSITRPTIRLC
jgi:hypothetical protein